MRRRSLLAAVAAAGAAGCLGTLEEPNDEATESVGSVEERRYEECEREAITHREFPDEIRAEIDEAIDDAYEAERIHLADAMDVDDGYVIVDGTYYEPVLERIDDSRRLSLEADETPELSPRSFDLENRSDDRLTGTVTVETEDGKRLLERAVDADPVDDVALGSVARVGNHRVVVDPDDGESASGSLSVGITELGGVVTITDEGVAVIQSVADLAPCPWTE